MSMDTVYDRVQSETDVESRDGAEAAVRATLVTLAERLSKEEAKGLASFLPKPVSTWISDRESASEGDFSVDEFFQRVADREGVSKERAQRHAQAVMEALQTEITEPELHRAQQQLPDEYDMLFS